MRGQSSLCALALLAMMMPGDAFPVGALLPHTRARPCLSRHSLRMGFLGWDFGQELGGKGIREVLGIISCEAAHILVKGPGGRDRCMEIKEEILDNISIPMGIGIEDSFAAAARAHSACPSAKDGGNLGIFKPGQMVPEFDQAAFGGPILAITGPVCIRVCVIRGREIEDTHMPTCTSPHAHTRTRIHTHTHTYTHIHIHTHTQVETKFGHHLILVKRRTGDAEAKSGGCG